MTEPAPAPAPAPAPTPTPAPAPPWYDGVDAETIGHWDNKGWKKDDPKALTVELTKAWKGLEKHFGAPADQILRLPKDGDEAAWKQVWERLGAPKEAKDYDFSAIKFNGGDLDQAFADKMRAALHGANVPKDRATSIVKTVIDYLEGADKAEASERAAALQADRKALEAEWTNNFEFNRLTAMQGAKRLGVTEDDVSKMQDTLGYKRTMDLFFKIGRGTTEDTFVESGGGNGQVTTRNGATARLAELQSDPVWRSNLLAGRSQERKEFDNLMQMIHGAAA